MVGALIWYDYYHDRAQIAQASVATAHAMMSAVDRELFGIQAALFALATSPSLASDDLSAFYRQAQEVLKTQNANNIVLVDRGSQQRLNTSRPLGSELPSGAGSGLERVFETGQPITTDIFMGPATKKLLIAVSVPVYRGDTITYVLSAAIFPERLSGLLTAQHLPEDWIGVIFDSTGTIVARTHQMGQFLGKKGAPDLIARMVDMADGFLETTTVEGIPVLAVFSRSAVTKWSAAIGIPFKNLTGELVYRLWWLVAGTAVLLLSSLALAWTIGSKIARPIDKLMAPALALGSGELVTVPSLQLREADEVGKALTRASEMLVSAQTRANHDALTGLANRTLFHEILRQQLDICKRKNTNIAIIYVDLDGFKVVNDRYGHAAGDEVLCIVAMRLKNLIRGADLAVRLGGDEFAVLLIDAGLEGAQAVSQKLIDGLSAPYSIGSIITVISASIGISVYPVSGTTSEMLLQRADEAMYKAKAAGKRRYEIAT